MTADFDHDEQHLHLTVLISHKLRGLPKLAELLTCQGILLGVCSADKCLGTSQNSYLDDRYACCHFGQARSSLCVNERDWI